MNAPRPGQTHLNLNISRLSGFERNKCCFLTTFFPEGGKKRDEIAPQRTSARFPACDFPGGWVKNGAHCTQRVPTRGARGYACLLVAVFRWAGCPAGRAGSPSYPGKGRGCGPQILMLLFHQHGGILPENESGSKRTVHLTRFSFGKSKWTLPPILALLAGDLWVFHFCGKRGCLKIFKFFGEYIFSGWFRAKGAKGKRGFRRRPGR